MRVFVTGVTGFLGSHIAETLLQAGHEVVGLARRPASLDPDLVPWMSGQMTPSADSSTGRGTLRLLRGSLTDVEVIAEGIRTADAIVHAAGLIRARSEREFMAVNRDGTDTVVQLAVRHAGPLRRIVLISSQAAGGPAREGKPVTADQPPRPVSAYGRSKRAGEERALARAGELPVTVLRPPVIFGARDTMLRGLFAAVARGLMPVWGDGTNSFNVVHAPDVARAALLGIEVEHPSGSILYPSDPRPFTWLTFIGALAQTLGVRVRTLRVPETIFTAIAAASTAVSFISRRPPQLSFDKIAELRQHAWLCSSESTRELLGWAPATEVESALTITHAWYKARRLL